MELDYQYPVVIIINVPFLLTGYVDNVKLHV